MYTNGLKDHFTRLFSARRARGVRCPSISACGTWTLRHLLHEPRVWSAGEVITLTAGTAVTAFSGYLPDLAPSSVTMTGNNGNQLRNTVLLGEAAIVTPEPASIVLTATGLAFLFGIARRKRTA